MDLPQRKVIRLKDYDYSSNGAYYVTICVVGRHNILGKIAVGANCVRPLLSEIGCIIENEIPILSNTYDCVFIDKYIIMPNHIHMIILIVKDGRTEFAPTLSRVIKQFKGSITKQIGFSVWEKSFNDRIIRNMDEYKRIWHYIDNNPAKWAEDEYYENI